jgi:hypothetical protein
LIGEYNLANPNTIRYKLLLEGLDPSLFLLYNSVMFLNKTYMTVTKNEFGQMNMWAKEPSMYMTKEDLERYGIEPYAEKAEKMNGRWAMMGIIAGFISYAATGKFFFGIF